MAVHTERLTEPQARLYQEWIANRRRHAVIIAEIEKVGVQPPRSSSRRHSQSPSATTALRQPVEVRALTHVPTEFFGGKWLASARRAQSSGFALPRPSICLRRLSGRMSVQTSSI
jgi:hypothetical protein